MELAIWSAAIASVIVDNVFRPYIWLCPLYFYLESLSVQVGLGKLMRIITFSFLTQVLAARELNFAWILATTLVVSLEVYRDHFYHHWVASLFQIVVFLVPSWSGRLFPVLYGFIVSTVVFMYVYRNIRTNQS